MALSNLRDMIADRVFKREQTFTNQTENNKESSPQMAGQPFRYGVDAPQDRINVLQRLSMNLKEGIKNSPPGKVVQAGADVVGNVKRGIAQIGNSAEEVGQSQQAGVAEAVTPEPEVTAQITEPVVNEKHETIRQGILYTENRGAVAEGKNVYEVIGGENRDGTRDLGKYQVNPESLKDWGKAWLGKSYTPEEFLADPEAQEEFFTQFLAVVDRLDLTPEEASMTWHKGWGALGKKPEPPFKTKDEAFRASLRARMEEAEKDDKSYLNTFREGIKNI